MSPPVGIDAARLYELAYAAHYKQRQYARARSLYTDLVERFCGSEQAAYARSQLLHLPPAHESGELGDGDDGTGPAAASSSSTASIFSTSLRAAAAAARAEQRKAADLRSMVSTATALAEPHTVVRPVRVIAPVVAAHADDVDSSKARLAAFEAAVLWLAQKATESGCVFCYFLVTVREHFVSLNDVAAFCWPQRKLCHWRNVRGGALRRRKRQATDRSGWHRHCCQKSFG